MTLDEAIMHCEYKSDCTECGKEHAQLAAWLKELKILRVPPKCGGWIPVEERLPEPYEDVLVTEQYMSSNTGKITTGYDIEYFIPNSANEWSGNGIHHKVIAWQPLPKLYEEQ